MYKVFLITLLLLNVFMTNAALSDLAPDDSDDGGKGLANMAMAKKYCQTFVLQSYIADLVDSEVITEFKRMLYFPIYDMDGVYAGKYHVESTFMGDGDQVYTGVYSLDPDGDDNFGSQIILTGSLLGRPGISIVSGTGQYTCVSGQWNEEIDFDAGKVYTTFKMCRNPLCAYYLD
jgi:hypothetical protein